MITPDLYWDALEKDSDEEKQGYLLRRIHKSGLYIGIDISKKQKILLLELDKLHEIDLNRLPIWRGITIEFGRIEPDKRILLTRLMIEEHIDIFNSLIRHLCVSLENAENSSGSIEQFIDCLENWRYFFDKYGVKILKDSAQRGLYGELYFLSNYVLAINNSISALQTWRGHDRKHHDFMFSSGNVEVKTTIKKEHRTVIIDSEKQLDNTGLNSLYLYCLAIETKPKADNTIVDLVNIIYEKISHSMLSVSTFNKYLSRAGYCGEHEKYYSNTGYIIKKEYFFIVEEGFPRITNCPNGVGDIKYSIVLSACRKFLVEITPRIKELVEG